MEWPVDTLADGPLLFDSDQLECVLKSFNLLILLKFSDRRDFKQPERECYKQSLTPIFWLSSKKEVKAQRLPKKKFKIYTLFFQNCFNLKHPIGVKARTVQSESPAFPSSATVPCYNHQPKRAGPASIPSVKLPSCAPDSRKPAFCVSSHNDIWRPRSFKTMPLPWSPESSLLSPHNGMNRANRSKQCRCLEVPSPHNDMNRANYSKLHNLLRRTGQPAAKNEIKMCS